MSSPPDWLQFYQGHTTPTSMFADRVSDATTVTATVNSSSSAGPLSPDGRVSKPARRRSRASRRTPTTLLNTDTANFRAMVQQFTGGHSTAFSAGGNLGGAPNMSFGMGSRQSHVNPGAVMVPQAGGYHLQYQQQQPFPFQQNMFSGDGFLQRLSNNTRPNNSSNMGGINLDAFGVSSTQQQQQQPPPAGSGNENRNNNSSYMF